MTPEDDASIRNLIGRVAWLQDKWSSKREYLDNYTTECVWQIEGDIAYVGHQNVGERLQFALDVGISGPGLPARHCVTSIEVIPHSNSDIATVRSHCIMVSAIEGSIVVAGYSDYTDTLKRETGRWLIAKRFISGVQSSLKSKDDRRK